MGDRLENEFERERREMAALLKRRGIESEAVLAAMGKVARERFVPERLRKMAYEDGALPIEQGQTISQPYVVALMIEAAGVAADHRVLEIGTGSGYSAAVMAEMGASVFTIERHAGLAETARGRLADSGYETVSLRTGDGTLGWPEAAPFDAIIVTAGGPSVPESLREQLAVGGILVMPVGSMARYQMLMRIERLADDKYGEENLGAVAFVPLIGVKGWPE